MPPRRRWDSDYAVILSSVLSRETDGPDGGGGGGQGDEEERASTIATTNAWFSRAFAELTV